MACVRPGQCTAGVDCGGDCCAGACVGGSGDSVCTAPNVDFSAGCAPSCAGGDPRGTWHLAGACGDRGQCGSDAGSGVVGPEGALVVGSGGGTGLPDLGENLYGGCGQLTLGQLSGVGGSWSADAGTVGGDAYCVQGSTLYVFLPPDPQSSSEPHLTALRFVR